MMIKPPVSQMILAFAMLAGSATFGQTVTDALRPERMYDDDSAFVQRPSAAGGVAGGAVGLAVGLPIGAALATTEMIAGVQGDRRISQEFRRGVFASAKICNRTLSYAFGVPFYYGKIAFYDTPRDWFD